MLSRAAHDAARVAGKLAVQLWPLWLSGFALIGAVVLWRQYLVALPDHTTRTYVLALRAWPSVALCGPILVMVAALIGYETQLASRTMAVAAITGVTIATILAVRPEYMRLAPYFGRAPLASILGAVDLGIGSAVALGATAIGLGISSLRGDKLAGRGSSAGLRRAASDNHGHAAWLPIKNLRQLFPGPDPTYGGIVVGEAYRVDRDRTSAVAFDPSSRRTWGQGGSAPLLIDPCRSGPTHGLVIAGSGGFKTTSVCVPTMLSWTGSAVVLDPSREIGPMVSPARLGAGHRVVTLDPERAQAGAFNVLDWIDTSSPLAESNVEAVVGWISGEVAGRGKVTSGSEFFRDQGKALIACVLADVLWDPDLKPADKTLKWVRTILTTPEDQLREVLKRIHATSASSLARELAATLMGLVADTFSGVYANAARDTRWLSTPAYADLVSGSSFKAEELTTGRLTLFVQIPLKVLQSTPALGRVIVGALLNAAYEADGRVQGRILFMLDEVARLGFLSVLEQARDAGRKYGITLLLLYQSLGQLTEQWGREGKQAWYDSTSWRLFAAVQDFDTARELSAMCGEYGVVAMSSGDSAGTSGRFGASHANSGRSENRSEIRRALIKPDEILQDTRSDEAFVIVRGAKPIRCGRAIYFRRPEMAALVQASRFNLPPGAAA